MMQLCFPGDASGMCPGDVWPRATLLLCAAAACSPEQGLQSHHSWRTHTQVGWQAQHNRCTHPELKLLFVLIRQTCRIVAFDKLYTCMFTVCASHRWLAPLLLLLDLWEKTVMLTKWQRPPPKEVCQSVSVMSAVNCLPSWSPLSQCTHTHAHTHTIQLIIIYHSSRAYVDVFIV